MVTITTGVVERSLTSLLYHNSRSLGYFFVPKIKEAFMQHNYTLRKKDGGIQIIISYLYDGEMKWRTKSKQGFKKESDAKRWANDMLVELQSLEKKYSRKQEDLTLGKAGELWLATKMHLTPNTIVTYRNALSLLSDYADLPLIELTPIKTQEIQGKIHASNYGHIKCFWNYMQKMKMIEDNYLNLKKSKKSKKLHIVSKSLYQKMLKECTNPEHKIFIKLAYMYGLRSGEILGITPDHVSKDKIIIDRQWARINNDKGVIYGFKELKNKEQGHRTLPFDADLYKELNSMKFNFAESRYFHTCNSSLVNQFLDRYGHSAHDFRHTRASEMVHEGFNLTYIAYFIGDTLDTIIRNYVHLSDDMINQQNNKFLSTF